MLKPLIIVSLGIVTAAPLVHHAASDKKAERMKQFITWHLDDTLDDLDASDAQRKEVARVRDAMFVEAAPLAAGKEAAHAEVLAQLEAPRPDAQRLHALLDERLDAARAFGHKLVDAAVGLHSVFTPEQRATLAAKIRAKAARH